MLKDIVNILVAFVRTRMSRVLLVLPVLGFWFWGGTVFGCRYSVRDVGFVYFGAAPYKLYGYVGPDTAQGIRDSFD